MGMKILVLSQTFWPDTVSTAQHLHDLTVNLSKRGHQIDLITSIRNYENPKNKFKKVEMYENIRIIRLNNTGLGKSNKLFRLLDFLSFNLLIIIKLSSYLFRKYDCVIGMTSPPLLSYIGVIYSKIIRSNFVYWTMDLQPELSIIANYVKKDSFFAKSLQKKGDYIFRHSKLIFALDKYMKEHIIKRQPHIHQDKIKVIPVWPVVNKEFKEHRLKNPFRIQNNFGSKIVVMYSGNHSVMHPIDTLLESAKELKSDNRFLFVHIGGGVRIKEVKDFKEKHQLDNIITLAYQPRENIHLSLGSSDIQVVTLGNECVGYTHPNKIYGALFLGKPVLYIGPKNSHITDILSKIKGNILVSHGEKDKLVKHLTDFANAHFNTSNIALEENTNYALNHFKPSILVNKMIDEIEKIEIN